MSRVIGVLGGMGPGATNALCAAITAATPASTDAEHVAVLCYNNPHIPSRVDGARGTGPSPLPEMIRTARVLERGGAGLLVMPCNLAHLWHGDLAAALDVPVLDMVGLTVAHLAAEPGGVGLLASPATVERGIYNGPLAAAGLALVLPSPADQEALVNDAIYGPGGVKAGFVDGPRAQLTAAVARLAERGAARVIAGCTEVSVALDPAPPGPPLVDPLLLLARAAVAWARA